MSSIDFLLQGNERFLKKIDKKEIENLTKGQHPKAIIVGCSDSRVTPEIIFDQKLGEIFVVRIAGHISVEASVLGSIEYAVEHLRVPLIVVLGHTNCGAVKGAFERDLPGHIGKLVAHIKPVRKKVEESKVRNVLYEAVRENVRYQMNKILEMSEIVKHALAEGKLQMYSALYDLATGKVELIL